MASYHFADQEALLYRLASAEQEVVFLVGSALTKSVHGVPGVPGDLFRAGRVRRAVVCPLVVWR